MPLQAISNWSQHLVARRWSQRGIQSLFFTSSGEFNNFRFWSMLWNRNQNGWYKQTIKVRKLWINGCLICCLTIIDPVVLYWSDDGFIVETRPSNKTFLYDTHFQQSCMGNYLWSDKGFRQNQDAYNEIICLSN